MKWSSFAGLSQDDLVQRIRLVLERRNVDYSEEDAKTRRIQAFMLGSNSNVWQVRIEEGATRGQVDPIDIRVISVSMDPLSRLWSKVLTGSAERPGSLDVSVVEVVRVTTGNAQCVQAILRGVIESCDRPPWNVEHHPRFAVAPLLAWQVRRRWQTWQRSGPVL